MSVCVLVVSWRSAPWRQSLRPQGGYAGTAPLAWGRVEAFLFGRCPQVIGKGRDGGLQGPVFPGDKIKRALPGEVFQRKRY